MADSINYKTTIDYMLYLKSEGWEEYGYITLCPECVKRGETMNTAEIDNLMVLFYHNIDHMKHSIQFGINKVVKLYTLQKLLKIIEENPKD
jgi:hypothetical protein